MKLFNNITKKKAFKGLKNVVYNKNMYSTNVNLFSTIYDNISYQGALLSILPISALYVCGYYRISNPHEYIVRTGFNIKDMEISKKCLLLPFQKLKYIDMTPRTYTFELNSMTSELIPFVLPVVYTIGPKDDVDSLKKYSKYILNLESDIDGVCMDLLIKGIIEGTTRTLASKSTALEIFNDKEGFKKNVTDLVQIELDQYGLLIQNANIKELTDNGDSKYFENLSRKALSNAEANAKISIATAQMTVDIGEKEKNTETRQQIAQLETSALISEKSRDSETRQKISELESLTNTVENKNKQDICVSNAELEKIRANTDKEVQMVQTRAINEVKIYDAQLQQQLEREKNTQEIEKYRALELSRDIVKSEQLLVTTEAQQKSIKLLADAKLYEQTNNAKGIYEMLQSEARGLNEILKGLNGDSNMMIQYMMIKNNVYPTLAKHNAEAIQGLQPKMTIWNTSNTGSNNSSISDIFKQLPPLLSTIHEQTGLKPAEWLVSGLEKNNDTLDDMKK